MKQIIPFKQELLFKTKVSEITSISLEHNLSLKEDDLISGDFYITGDYKMTEGSINREKFDFKIPFDIALDSRYDMDSIVIDIDNFYYEVINNESLQVNIDVYIEGEKIIEEEYQEAPIIDDVREDEDDKVIVEEDDKDKVKEEVEDVKIDTDTLKEESDISDREVINSPVSYQNIEIDEEEVESSITSNKEFNIFENIDNSDTYVTYHVYIVKEGDTIDSIIERYKVSKDDIALYNSLEEIKPGMKLVIPNGNE